MSGVEAVGAEVRIEAASDVYVEASLLWDDLRFTNVAELPKDALKMLASDADDMSKLLVTQFIAVRRFTAEQMPEIGAPAKIIELKKLLIEFRNEAWSQLVVHERPSVAEAATALAAVANTVSAKPKPAVSNVVQAIPSAPIDNALAFPFLVLRCALPVAHVQVNPRSIIVPQSLPSQDGADTIVGIQFNPGVSAITVEVATYRFNSKGGLIEVTVGFVDGLNQCAYQHPEGDATIQGVETSFPPNPGGQLRKLPGTAW